MFFFSSFLHYVVKYVSLMHKRWRMNDKKVTLLVSSSAINFINGSFLYIHFTDVLCVFIWLSTLNICTFWLFSNFVCKYSYSHVSDTHEIQKQYLWSFHECVLSQICNKELLTSGGLLLVNDRLWALLCPGWQVSMSRWHGFGLVVWWQCAKLYLYVQLLQDHHGAFGTFYYASKAVHLTGFW